MDLSWYQAVTLCHLSHLQLVKQRKQLAEMSIVQNADGEHVLVAPSREEHTIIEEEVVLPPVRKYRDKF